MARIRSIHPDALKSRKLSSCSAEAERAFWRLLTHCDDDGRAEDEPDLFAAFLFPLVADATGDVVDEWLEELSHRGLIHRYEVGGTHYLQVVKWGTYQHPKRKVPSTLPPAPSPQAREQWGDDKDTPHPGVPYGVEGRGVGVEQEGEGCGEGESNLAYLKARRIASAAGSGEG